MFSRTILIGISFSLLAVVEAHAQEDLSSALKSETCKKVGMAAAAVVTLRDSGATTEVATAVMNAGAPEADPSRPLLLQIVKDVYKFKELSIHSHRMYRWLSCANQSLGKNTKDLEKLAPELKKCQALSNQQTQINCMAGVVNET